jgi:ATP-dependent Clp protease ATP-binding subunit ClpC
LGNDFIGTEHLLLGLIREGDNTAVRILKSFNIDLYELRKEIELAVKDKTGKNIANINSLPLTKQAEKVIRVTVLEAKALKSATVETEHLMLSILKNKENIATQILNQFDVDYDLFRQELGIVKSNDPRAEFTDENDDDFDEEKKYSQSKSSSKQSNAKVKLLCLIISVVILLSWPKWRRWILLLAVNWKLKGYHKYFPVVKRITQS